MSEEPETFTKEEVEAQIEAKETELKENMAGLDDKDKNFAALRKAKEKAEQDRISLESSFDDKLSTFKKGLLEDKITQAINKVAGNDTEQFKKVKHYFDNFKGDIATDADITEKVNNAAILAGNRVMPQGIGSGFSSGIGSAPVPNTNTVGKLKDPGSRNVAAMLGITDEKLKEHKAI